MWIKTKALIQAQDALQDPSTGYDSGQEDSGVSGPRNGRSGGCAGMGG
jgi:hypothetical protein